MSETKFDTVDLTKLPAFQNIDKSQIKAGMDKMTAGATTWYGLARLLVIGGLVYGIWTYILPKVFIMAGQVAALIVGIGMLVAAYAFRKPFWRFLANRARALDKRLIKENPWLVFEKQRRKLEEAGQKFVGAFNNMKNLAFGTKEKADIAAQKAKEYQDETVRLKSKADSLEEKMAATKGKDVNLYTQYFNEKAMTVAKANSAMLRYQQQQTMAEKYAARGLVMDELVRKLSSGKTYIDIKKVEFENTVEMLKIDYDFFKESAEATGQIRSSMTFDKEWEVAYAIEATKAITASYISETEMNLNDIENLTANYNIDNDAIFKKLDALTQRIETGEEKIVDVAQYQNPEYVPTAKDRQNAGFGGSNFFN